MSLNGYVGEANSCLWLGNVAQGVFESDEVTEVLDSPFWR